jgi:hypothetical protein
MLRRHRTVTTYVLDNASEHATTRFASLEACYDPVSTRQFEEIGVSPGWSCLEVGGGGGSIANWLGIRGAVTSGATAALWDIRRPEPGDPPDIIGDGYALQFRVTSSARCYATSEYLNWLTAAGFIGVQAHPLPLAPFHVLVTGRTPTE